MKILAFFIIIFIPFCPISAQNAAYYFELGLEQNQKENYSEAIDSFDKAIALAPQVAEGYAMRAFAKSKLHLLKFAIEDYKKSLQINPDNIWVLREQAFLNFQMGLYEETIVDVYNLFQLNTKNDMDFYMLAESKYKLKQAHINPKKTYSFYEIVGDYSQAIALKPDFAMAYRRRAEARNDSLLCSWWIPSAQEIEAICADWQKAIQLGDRASEKLLDKYCKNIPERIANHLFLLAKQKEIENNFTIALNLYGQILQMGLIDSPIFLSSLLSQAELHSKLGNLKATLEDYNYCFSLRNIPHLTLQQIFFKRGLLFVQLQENQKALSDFDKAIELGYDHSWIYFERANIQYLLGQKEKACEDWLIAKERGSKDAEAKLKQYCNTKKRK